MMRGFQDLALPLRSNGLGHLATVSGNTVWRQKIESVLMTCCVWKRDGQTVGGQRLARPEFG